MEKFSDLIVESECDLWAKLKSTQKPIVLYGTGDGADKILDILESKDIKISGIFSSDGFKKGKTFRGFEVVSFREICEKFGDFMVLLSFASSLENVIENVCKIGSQYELYAPDVPVFGSGLFDSKYFYAHQKELEAIFDRLADDASRHTFINAINYRLSGKIDYLFDCESSPDEQYETLLSDRATEGYVDVGAYTGDTVCEFCSHFGKDIRISAYEPDGRNFKKMLLRLEDAEIYGVNTYNIAAWSEKSELTFFSRSGRNSAASANRENNFKKTLIPCDSIDNTLSHPCGVIKIDAEGSEMQVIEGMNKTILAYKPTIKIAAYHRTEDYFKIPEQILAINPDYKVYMRHLRYIPCWDTDFFFV